MTTRLLGTCRQCKAIMRVDTDGRIYRPYGAGSGSIKRTHRCGATVTLREVVATESKRSCDSRCLNARGPSCDCQCIGANHGIGHGGA